MQILKSLLFFLLLPAFGYSQQLSGIWIGTLSNDSLTVRKDQSFEIALTTYREKVSGYTYSTFVVNDTLFYIIKKVKGEINGTVCVVEDEEIITHNFQRKPDKGVRVSYTFYRNQQDSNWTIDGNWKTNATKKYYSISGGISASQEKDISRSKLYDHLGDLNLQQTLSFINPRDIKSEKKTPVVADAKKSFDSNIVIRKPDVKTDVAKIDQKPADNRSANDITKADTKKSVDSNIVIRKPDVKTDVVRVEQKPADNKQATDITKTETKKSADTIAVGQIPKAKNDVAKVEQKPADNKRATDIIKTDTKKPADTIAVVQIPKAKNDIAKVEQRPADNKQATDSTKTDTKKPVDTIAVVQIPKAKTDIAKVEQKPADNKQATDIIKTDTKKPADTIAVVQIPKAKTDIAKVEQKPADNKQATDITKTDTKKSAEDYVYAELKKSERKLKPAAEMVSERASVLSETVYFKSDSLVLALYDNGEVDGDTVSVILNGEVIIEKQLLKSVAFKKTIYLAPDESDSVLLVLYAENLGLYPPNTGLMIIKDGEESYYVRFKADYNQNAAILLRRKPK